MKGNGVILEDDPNFDEDVDVVNEKNEGHDINLRHDESC